LQKAFKTGLTAFQVVTEGGQVKVVRLGEVRGDEGENERDSRKRKAEDQL